MVLLILRVGLEVVVDFWDRYKGRVRCRDSVEGSGIG